jgi:cysteine desulfurase/selenocysteine lyase
LTIYLDNAASSCPKPARVPEAVERCLRESCANPGRGAHRLAVEAARIIYDTRRKAAALLGVKNSADVIFTQNATDALNMAMRGLLKPGDHVISTRAEHNAIARPLHSLSRDGVEVSLVEVDGAGRLDPKRIIEAITAKTRLVALAHISNVTAAVQPVVEIAAALEKRKIPLLVDAAQSAGAVELEASSMPLTLLACTGHKSLLGPQGIGLLVIPPQIELASVRQGGTGSHSDEPEQDRLDRPDRYESGTLNTPGIAGLGAGIDFIEARGLSELSSHKMELVERLHQLLAGTGGVDVYGPPQGEIRGHLVSFNIGDMHSSEVAAILDRRYDIASRAGLHCAPGAHAVMGTLNRGVVRLSVGVFNTAGDIETAAAAVAEIALEAQR